MSSVFGRSAAFATGLALALLAGGCGPDEGIKITCVAVDAAGTQWRASDITELAASTSAAQICGEQSAQPDSCLVRSCGRSW